MYLLDFESFAGKCSASNSSRLPMKNHKRSWQKHRNISSSRYIADRTVSFSESNEGKLS